MSTWTEDREQRLVALHAQELPASAIGALLKVSRNAVIGRIARLRAAADPRVRPAGDNPATTRAEQRRRDKLRLADAFADGAPTLQAAAITARMAIIRARELWDEVRHDLGWQAQ